MASHENRAQHSVCTSSFFTYVSTFSKRSNTTRYHVTIFQELHVVFKPGVLVVGPDPNDGLLKRHFIFYYQLTTNSLTTVQDVNIIMMRGLKGTVHVHNHKNTVRLSTCVT